MDELAQLYPGAVVVEVQGGPVPVYPLRARQLAGFAAAAGPLMEVYSTVRAGGLDALGEEDWRGIVELHADALIAAIAVAVERKPAEIGELFLDDLAVLAMTIIQVNLDFFTRGLGRMATDMGGLAERIRARGGPTLSTASSAPDTATPASTP